MAIEKDQAEIDADASLPCVIPQQPCMDYWPERDKCAFCLARPAVAAELRKRDEDIAIYKKYWEITAKETVERGNRIVELESQLATLRDCQGVCSHELEAGELRAELAQAKQEREDFSAIGHERIRGLEQEIEKLKSELRDERALTDEDYSLIEIENNRLRAELAALKAKIKNAD